jgi:uncharacterized protein (TIRG00374 family)
MCDDPAMTEAKRRSRHRRAWQLARFVFGISVAVAVLYALTGRRGELSGASQALSHLEWGWLLAAVVAEGVSMVSFALLQRRLLAGAGVRAPLGSLTALSLAETAISNSMPAGPAISALFTFRWFRRYGADDAVAAWVLGAVFVAASVSLALLAAVGVGVAGAEGASLDLVVVTAATLAIALAIGAVFVQHRLLVRVARWAVFAAFRVLRRMPRESASRRAEQAVERLTAVSLSPKQVAAAVGWGLANWLGDASALVLAYMAVDASVPWKGFLLAYGAGQLAVNLPITPGGLGVVEGSLTIALVAFGGAQSSTVAAVLIYRILSFWAELPIGWSCWGWLAWRGRARQLEQPILDASEVTA